MSESRSVVEIMAEVVDALEKYQAATTGLLVDEIGTNRTTLSKALASLQSTERIEYVHEGTALWTLTSSDVPTRCEGSDD